MTYISDATKTSIVAMKHRCFQKTCQHRCTDVPIDVSIHLYSFQISFYFLHRMSKRTEAENGRRGRISQPKRQI